MSAIRTIGVLIAWGWISFGTPTNAFAQTGKQRGATFGGLAGAIAGGLIGDNNDEAGAGAAIGGVVGAVAGGILGDAADKDAEMARQRAAYYQAQRQQYAQQQQAAVMQSAVTLQDVISMTRSVSCEKTIHCPAHWAEFATTSANRPAFAHISTSRLLFGTSSGLS